MKLNLTPTAAQREILDRVHQHLRAEFRRKGHGSKSKALANVGADKTTLDQSFKRGTIRFLLILQMLDQLEIPIEDFLCRTFGLQRQSEDLLDAIVRLEPNSATSELLEELDAKEKAGWTQRDESGS